MSTQTTELALYRHAEYGYTSAFEPTDHFEDSSEYTRISEILTVTFDMLPDNEVVAAEVARLKETRQEIQAKAEMKVRAIDDRIQSLLALPHLED